MRLCVCSIVSVPSHLLTHITLLQYWVPGFSLQYHKSSLTVTGRCYCTLTQMRVFLKLGVHTSCNSLIFVTTIQMKTISLKIIIAEWINFRNYGSAYKASFNITLNMMALSEHENHSLAATASCYYNSYNHVVHQHRNGTEFCWCYKMEIKLTHVQKHQRNKTSDFLVKTNHPPKCTQG